MQQRNQKTKMFAEKLGELIKEQRLKRTNCSINQFAHEYDLDVGNVSRIENGRIELKVVTLWKIAEALDIKLSELILLLEEKLGNEFQIKEE